jgi:hypothetical protein
MMLIGDEPQSYPSYRDIASRRPSFGGIARLQSFLALEIPEAGRGRGLIAACVI